MYTVPKWKIDVVILVKVMNLRTVPTNTEVFYDYVGKADFSKGYWNPKTKLGVTVHSLTFKDNEAAIILKSCKI